MNMRDLKQQIYDETLSPSTREHAYYNYWMQQAASSAALSREEMAEMLSCAHWVNPLGDIISYLCQTKKIDVDDAKWMKARIPSEAFAHKQLLALEAINNSSLNWKEKYMIAKGLKANWAISQILRDVPPEEVNDAQHLITSLNLGKNTRRWQLEVLSNNRTEVPDPTG